MNRDQTLETALSASMTRMFRSLSHRQIFCFGQNVNVGSYISGLSSCLRGLEAENVHIVNNPNIETTLGGIALGATASTEQSEPDIAVLLIKQLDFVTLMIDDLIHTVSQLKAQGSRFSLNLITFQVDSGYEGPQSRLAFGLDLANLIDCNISFCASPLGLTETMKRFGEDGVNIFLISQRQFKKLNPDTHPFDMRFLSDGTGVTTVERPKATMVFLGSSFSHFQSANQKAQEYSYDMSDCDVFRLNVYPWQHLASVAESVDRSGHVLIFDDSKTTTNVADGLITTLKKYSLNEFRHDIFFDKVRATNLYVTCDEVNFVRQ